MRASSVPKPLFSAAAHPNRIGGLVGGAGGAVVGDATGLGTTGGAVIGGAGGAVIGDSADRPNN